jgi:TolB-like protein
MLIYLTVSLGACASYHMGSVGRSIPGGYKQISVPVFKNKSQEVGIEISFTNALIQEFQRSKAVKIVDKNLSEVLIEGKIDSVEYQPQARKTSGDASAPFLPDGTVIATEYRIILKATLRIIRQADGLELWTGGFAGERTYAAPQVTLAGVNSVNPLYNLSARRQNIDVMASDMMAEAHDRMTENF